MEVSKSFSIEALLAPSSTSATAKPEADQRTCESPEVDQSPHRDDDATSTYRDREGDSATAPMSPRSYASTGSSMAGDERPGSAMSETAATTGDEPSSSSPELVTSGHAPSGLGRHLPGLIQSLHDAHRGMLDAMQTRGPSAIPPGIIQSSPGHPPFPTFAYNGFHHAAAITGLPGRAHQTGSGTGSRAISPGALQTALAGSGSGSAFHAPSSSAVRLGVRPPVTAVITSAGTTSTSAADNALQRLAAQAAQQHMHSLQLDWLARAGVYMPRLIDYNGTSKVFDVFIIRKYDIWYICL